MGIDLCCFFKGPAVGSEAERQRLLQQAKNLVNTIAALGRELQAQGVLSPAVAERLNNLQVCTYKIFSCSLLCSLSLSFSHFLFYYWNVIISQNALRQLENVLEMAQPAQNEVLPSDVAQMAIDLSLTCDSLNNVHNTHRSTKF